MMRIVRFVIATLAFFVSPIHGESNPYRTFGLNRSASSKDIQKKYRTLCLKFHPDKQRSNSPKQQKAAEEKFKQVQHAYSLIGDEESRRRYDTGSLFSSGMHRPHASSRGAYPASPFASDPIFQAFFRSFESGNPSFHYFRPSAAGQGGMRFRPSADATASASTPDLDDFKSVYLQKVVIPLQDLYLGIENFQFRLKDNVFTRWRAALRGKVAYFCFFPSILYSFPLIQKSRLLGCVVTLIIMNTLLPKPSPYRRYKSALRKGTKGNGSTKVKFASVGVNEPEVVFVIAEGKHERYHRVNNDLHTTIYLSKQQAKVGCTRKVPPLDPDGAPVAVIVPPDTASGAVLSLPGEGWPIWNAHPDVYLYGELKVKVVITRQRKDRR